MILIGSHAARFHGIDLGREPADIDLAINDLEELKLFTDVRESVDHKGMFHAKLDGERVEIDATMTEANRLLEHLKLVDRHVLFCRLDHRFH